MSGLRLLLTYRRPAVVVLHLALVILANYLAFWLRFDGVIPDISMEAFVRMLPWVLVIRGVMFFPFGLYEGLWRYTGIWDLRNIVGGVLASTLVFYSFVHWSLRLTVYPRSIFAIDSLLLILLLGGVRLSKRIYRELGQLEREKRVLIYGAGDAGEMIVRDMKYNSFYDYEPIGFLDDNPAKTGQRIHGVKVLGTRDALDKILTEKQPNMILIAMPHAAPFVIRGLVKALEPFKIPIKTLPNLRDVLDGKIEINRIRNLSIEDLLERTPVGLNSEPIRLLVQGKRVLVTGAGGSIGSELCRQILALYPSSLVLYERYENGLYAVAHELASRDGAGLTHTVIGDVTDKSRVNTILAEHRPEIIFHAAAHKHVPLMELNPCEAVKNNILGTRIMVEAARRYEAERFLFISTDKAVNPTSVMGASKRVAELLVQSMNDSRGIFSVVRFGNVLGSNGSAVPQFLEQIKAGGPVTVTHPEMRRFFMLIPEAVQLVLHAGALAKGGDIFILEMGEPIKVLDLTRTLIQLSGFTPELEIPIVFTGIRPGEKLTEELVGKDETVEPSGVEDIWRIQSTLQPDPTFLAKKVEELEARASKGDPHVVRDLLCELVPTYKRATNDA